jgi:hypothetical protein
MYNIGSNKCPEFLDKEIKVCLKCEFYDNFESCCQHKSNSKVIERDSRLIIEYEHMDKMNPACEYFIDMKNK